MMSFPASRILWSYGATAIADKPLVLDAITMPVRRVEKRPLQCRQKHSLRGKRESDGIPTDEWRKLVTRRSQSVIERHLHAAPNRFWADYKDFPGTARRMSTGRTA